MPRHVRINSTPNPTGLTMNERQVAIEVIQSLRHAVNKLRREQQEYWEREELYGQEVQELWDRACRAAMNQLAGRQKSENGIFKLLRASNAHLDEADIDYVMRSLGYTEQDAPSGT